MPESSKQTISEKPVDNKRRVAMKKIGKYSAYTAPALLALLTPKKGRALIMSPPPN